MRTIGNLLWFILGGLIMGLAWWLLGIIAFITVVGIPWGRACFVMGNFSFFPFGKEAINRSVLTSRADIGTGSFGALGNIIWFVLAGFWLAIAHAVAGIAFFITIIGIPFGIQHLKLAGVAVFPIGKTIVSAEVAKAALEANAQSKVAAMRANK